MGEVVVFAVDVGTLVEAGAVVVVLVLVVVLVVGVEVTAALLLVVARILELLVEALAHNPGQKTGSTK